MRLPPEKAGGCCATGEYGKSTTVVSSSIYSLEIYYFARGDDDDKRFL